MSKKGWFSLSYNGATFVLTIMVLLTAFAPRATEKMASLAAYMASILVILVIYAAVRYIISRMKKIEKKLDRLQAAQQDNTQSRP